MGADPQQQKVKEELEKKQREHKAEQEAEAKKKAAKARMLSLNKKNLGIARRGDGKVNVLVGRRDAGKVTLLIGSGHDPELVARTEDKGLHGHVEVTEHGLIATRNLDGPAFEAAVKQVTPLKISYKPV